MTSPAPTPPPATTPGEDVGASVVVFNKDLFFGVTISNTLRTLGYTPHRTTSTTALTEVLQSNPEAALVIVDIGAVDDWEALRTALATAADIPTVAFGSHTNVEGLRSAKRIGITRVFSNGQFHREMGEIIPRYARSAEPRT